MSTRKRRRRRPKKVQPAVITQVIGFLGKRGLQPGWMASMRSTVKALMEECPKLSERQVFLAYDELCKPPFEYLRKNYQVHVNSFVDDDLVDFTEAQIEEARKDGALFDPHSGYPIRDWEEKLQVIYWTTDKLPRDPGHVATEKLVDAIHDFTNGEVGKQAVATAWRTFADLHGIDP